MALEKNKSSHRSELGVAAQEEDSKSKKGNGHENVPTVSVAFCVLRGTEGGRGREGKGRAGQGR